MDGSAELWQHPTLELPFIRDLSDRLAADPSKMPRASYLRCSPLSPPSMGMDIITHVIVFLSRAAPCHPTMMGACLELVVQNISRHGKEVV